jgi:hypothetical protein
VSKIEYFASTPVSPVSSPPSGHAAHRRPYRLLLVPAVLVVAVAAVWVFTMQPAPIDQRPVALPAALAGFPVANAGLQFAQHPDVQKTMRDDFGERPWDGRAYGGIPGPLFHLVVVRGDSDGKGMLTTTRPPHTEFGDVTCTQTFELEDLPGQGDAEALRHDSRVQCWRTSDSLSVSVLVVSTTAAFMPAVATAIDEVWALHE